LYLVGLAPLGLLPLLSGLVSIPTSSPSHAKANRLNILASAAALAPTTLVAQQENGKKGTPPPGKEGTKGGNRLHSPGPFNTMASLPQRIVKKILNLEFLQMSEVTAGIDVSPSPSRPSAPARLPATDVSQWMERYSIMAGLRGTMSLVGRSCTTASFGRRPSPGAT